MRSKIARARSDAVDICVVGHPTSSIGMGEHVRSVWRALREVGIRANIVDIYGVQPYSDDDLAASLADFITHYIGSGINIFCINGDEVPQAAAHLLERNIFSQGSYNIIYPAWELEHYPKSWAEQLDRFDEIWAPSAFIRDAIQEVTSTRVVHMPLACEVGRIALRSRKRFGIRESAYAFLFAFDFLSYLERKNPLAVIECFHKLIEKDPFGDVVLVIKTNNSDARVSMKKQLEEMIQPIKDRVVVIQETLSEAEMKALIFLTDCFVSLHRSEGFGRLLSEAMALGKPVITTGYSGNMDFCSSETAFIVPYELISLRPGDYPHWEGQRWADPDLERARQFMADLVSTPGLGLELGIRARNCLRANFSYLAAGSRYNERIQTIQTEILTAPASSAVQRQVGSLNPGPGGASTTRITAPWTQVARLASRSKTGLVER